MRLTVEDLNLLIETKGQPRILQFTPDSKTLIFTSNLSTSIQAYSIPKAELLPPLHSHPSTPKIVAVCPYSAILLTASSTPPTVLLQDLRTMGNSAISFCPSVSNAAVTCASFKMYDCEVKSNSAHFLLGFRDGTLALYRQPVPKIDETKPDWRLSPTRVQMGPPIEVYSYKRLHKPSMGGILSAEFLPGHRSRIISLGYDGRCRLIDFTDKGELLRTWYVTGEATCMSIVSSRSAKRRGRSERTVVFSGDFSDDSSKAYKGAETLIAVGTKPGNVLVFNVLGLLIHEINFGLPIVSVEWIGDMTASCPLPARDKLWKADPAKEEKEPPPPQPVLDLFLDRYDVPDDDKSSSRSGTVRRLKPSSVSTPPDTSAQFGNARDLFSPAFTPRSAVVSPSSKMSFDEYRNLHGSPEVVVPAMKRRRRQRIATDTFKLPNIPSAYPSSPDLSDPSSPNTPDNLINVSSSPMRRWSQPNLAPYITPVSGVLQSSSEDSGAEKMRTDTGEMTVWYTPPTSNHVQVPADVVDQAPVVSQPPLEQDPEPPRDSFSGPGTSQPEPKQVSFSPESHFTGSPRKGGLLHEVRHSPSRRLRKLKRKGSKLLGVIKEREPDSRDDAVNGETWIGELTAALGGVDNAQLVQDNAVLRSEVEALRREMQALKEMVVERKDGDEVVA